MDFVSTSFLVWSLVFIAAVWAPLHKYKTLIMIALGSAFVFYTSPLAGIVLIAELLFCFYTINLTKKMQWLYALVQISIVFSVFLGFKFLASQKSIILPLGISYFTFRLIHYVQESYRERLREHSFVEFVAYLTFFPTYLVGPINSFPEFLKNLRRRKWDNSQFSFGLERLVYGYAQLIILGNFLINYLLKNWIAANFTTDNTFSSLSIHSVHMWLDLYIRFSAYSSISIGIAAMSGFTVPENFQYPFLATNIREFWQRWHMSLTNWCKEYIFIPIAAITRKPFLAIGATMITIGIWHELSLRYILWGIYHSLGIIVFEKYSIFIVRKIPDSKVLLILQKIIGIAITLAFVVLSFPVTSIVNNFLINLLK